jgi:hypothetical protein
MTRAERLLYKVLDVLRDNFVQGTSGDNEFRFYLNSKGFSDDDVDNYYLKIRDEDVAIYRSTITLKELSTDTNMPLIGMNILFSLKGEGADNNIPIIHVGTYDYNKFYILRFIDINTGNEYKVNEISRWTEIKS